MSSGCLLCHLNQGLAKTLSWEKGRDARGTSPSLLTHLGVQDSGPHPLQTADPQGLSRWQESSAFVQWGIILSEMS